MTKKSDILAWKHILAWHNSSMILAWNMKQIISYSHDHLERYSHDTFIHTRMTYHNHTRLKKVLTYSHRNNIVHTRMKYSCPYSHGINLGILAYKQATHTRIETSKKHTRMALVKVSYSHDICAWHTRIIQAHTYSHENLLQHTRMVMLKNDKVAWF